MIENYIDLSELKDDAVFDRDDDNASSSDDQEKGLCIPQDRLEDLDFFSNFFDDDLIRLDHAMYFDEVSRNILCINSSRDDRHETSSLSEEIESKVAQESDDCSEQDVQEQKSFIGRGRFSVAQESDDCSEQDVQEQKSFIGRGRFSIQNKKPRSKILRKENRKLMIPRSRQHDGKRSAMMLESRETRRCSHCQAEDTPQWRAGPAGRNILCNACGLRYKVGRLVANYRPAASPSFDCRKHSNYYKRLMRKKIKIEEDGASI